MEFIEEVGPLSQLQFALQHVQELAYVLTQDLFGVHFHRTLVADDSELAGDRRFTFREGVERLDGLVLVGALRQRDLDADLLGREVADGSHRDLSSF